MRRFIAALAIVGGVLGGLVVTATPASAKPLCLGLTLAVNGEVLLPLTLCTPIEAPS